MDLDRGCDANAFQPFAVDQHVPDREQQQAAANEKCRRSEDSSLGPATDDLAKPIFLEAIGKDLLAAAGATVGLRHFTFLSSLAPLRSVTCIVGARVLNKSRYPGIAPPQPSRKSQISASAPFSGLCDRRCSRVR